MTFTWSFDTLLSCSWSKQWQWRQWFRQWIIGESVSKTSIFKLVLTYPSIFWDIWPSIPEFYTPNKTWFVILSSPKIWAWSVNQCLRKVVCQKNHELLDTLYVKDLPRSSVIYRGYWETQEVGIPCWGAPALRYYTWSAYFVIWTFHWFGFSILWFSTPAAQICAVV